ncbi:hypothetical protein [Hymenobacter weizhouensis]|uniref:hypothetical protein n=1 Tax=Hymenobacter sp. YIM 151500-1 TaxID=2987689 RepID=UPI002225F8A5|nr:hypothetical protein [Hymenobacter sp. YIM 151500-1]UYZ64889.1 hypothetical protein OIS53_08565 [Hymenobacter sp. YIM 151500-1]
MNPSQYPKEVYNLLYADENGEIVGLDEVQYMDPVPAERIPALVALLQSDDIYVAYQCGLILAAWGVKEGIEHLRMLVETRIDKTADFEPHRLWGEDNVYDVIARALSMAMQYTDYNKAEITALLARILELYGECYFESKLKYALLDVRVPELMPNIKQALQVALDHGRYYQASQLLPVLAVYDRAFAQAQIPVFERLTSQDQRIKYNLEEMQQYLIGGH